MTQPQVEAIVGMPPGDYRTRWSIPGGGLMQILPGPDPSYSVKHWLTNEGRLTVYFDRNGRGAALGHPPYTFAAVKFNEHGASDTWLEDKWYTFLGWFGYKPDRGIHVFN